MKYAHFVLIKNLKVGKPGLKPIVVDMAEAVCDQLEAPSVISTALSDLAYITFNLAYWRPGGVMVEHSAIVSFLKDQIEAFQLTSNSCSFYLYQFRCLGFGYRTVLLSGGT
ncbi:MAG: hypothetical protein R3C24_15695 [Cyanobacteriota/Melainabacteria group bacterium]